MLATTIENKLWNGREKLDEVTEENDSIVIMQLDLKWDLQQLKAVNNTQYFR